MSNEKKIVVIGAGPAGIRAAQALVHAGLHPVVLDEGMRWGGQIYRQPPDDAGFVRTKKALYGFEAKKADAVHQAMARILPEIEYRPEALAWGIRQGCIELFEHAQHRQVPFTHLIIASGATDRIFPVPGWTLPGCYSLGGAQVSLKGQGCAIGRNVVFAGTGPLLYLVAYQYAKAGANVVAVLDTSGLSSQIAAAPRLIKQPATLAKGLYYVAWLRAQGIRIERNVSIVGIEGQDAVRGIRWTRQHAQTVGIESTHTIDCDAVGIGYGLKPETQLADIAGCHFEFSDLNQCWIPTIDDDGRSSVPGIYLAGDGSGIAGADAAELSGRRAGLAVLADLGITPPPSDKLPTIKDINRRLMTIDRFRQGIEHAFPIPVALSQTWPDDMMVCRCEEITAGTLRQCIRGNEASEMNRLKALTRVGMGRCQGRMCAEAAMNLLSQELQKPLASVGRLRSQPPIKPLPIFCSQPDIDPTPCMKEASDD